MMYVSKTSHQNEIFHFSFEHGTRQKGAYTYCPTLLVEELVVLSFVITKVAQKLVSAMEGCKQF
jgi:hypothetical protein